LKTLKQITFDIEKALTQEMINLRTVDFFCDKFTPNEVVDKFDQNAFFSTLRVEGELIGIERIMDTSIVSVFKEWSKGKDITPKGNNCYEISRAVIKREWQNHGLYHVLTILTLRYLKEINAKTINCVLETKSNLHKFVQNLGAIKCGSPYTCYDYPFPPNESQAYTLNLADKEYPYLYQNENDRIIKVITKRNYQIISKV